MTKTTSSLTLAEIHKRVDAISSAMTAKALRQPHAEFQVKSNSQSSGILRWMVLDRYGDQNAYEFFRGEAVEVLDKMDARIAAMPDAEKAKLQAFMGALGNVIDLGREQNIEVDFLNPLVATMKRLSENALTDQRAA